MSLNEIIGNEKIKEQLIKTIQLGQTSHSYMFIGTEGVGKSLFAKELAHRLLCMGEGKKPCQTCKSCKEFISQNHPDFYELATTENSIKIEQIRMLQSKILEKPITAQKKIYVIDDADKMTKEAQNCLLKTLEEPPEYVCIILIVSNENAMLNTIKSRCTKINFQPIEEDKLKQFLKEKYGIEANTPTYVKAWEGSIKKALKMNEHKELYEELDNIFYHVEEKSLIDVLGKIEALYKNKELIYELLEYINTIFLEQAKENMKYIRIY